MGFTNAAYDQYFIKTMSDLTECGLPELSDVNDKLVQSFFVKSVFDADLDVANKPLAYFILRRIQSAIVEYRESRQFLVECVAAKGNRLSLYLVALSKIENVISYLYQAYEVPSKLMKQRLFTPGDGSTYERLNRCYIRIKHLELSTVPADLVQSTYLTNSSFESGDSNVTYIEIVEVLNELTKLGEAIIKGKPV